MQRHKLMTSPIPMASLSAAGSSTLTAMFGHWYVVLIAILAILIVLAVVLFVAYKLCRRFKHRSPALSSAIRDGGVHKSSSVNKSLGGAGSLLSIASTGSSRSAAPLIQGSSRPDVLIPERRPSSRGASIDPTQIRSECYAETASTDGEADDQGSGGGDDADRISSSSSSSLAAAAAQTGTLQFTVEYDASKTALTVTVAKATNLPTPKEPEATMNPYVKLQLLPEKRQKAKTKVVRKTSNPVFDESFTFYGVEACDLEQVTASLTLHLAVFNFDSFSKDEFVGELVSPLAPLDVVRRQRVHLALPLTGKANKNVDGQPRDRGELLVSLCYQPGADRLTVIVLKARNLPRMDIAGLSDPYVKVYLIFNGQRIAKKKTHVRKRTLNPVFNESFQFDLPLTQPGLTGIRLEFVVYDWDRVTRNETIGRLEIGDGVHDSEVEGHWNEVMTCPRKQIAEWHRLKE